MYFSFFYHIFAFSLSVSLSVLKNIINCFVHRKSHVKYIKLIHQQNNVLCTKYLCLVSSVYAFVQKWNNCRCHNIDYRQIWHRQNGKFITKSYPLVSRIITYFSSSNQKCSQYCSYFYYCHSHCCNEKIKQKNKCKCQCYNNNSVKFHQKPPSPTSSSSSQQLFPFSRLAHTVTQTTEQKMCFWNNGNRDASCLFFNIFINVCIYSRTKETQTIKYR